MMPSAGDRSTDPKLGPLIIFSGPSGTGKSTVLDRLLKDKVLAGQGLILHLSVSATTRPPRPGEKDGVNYFFWTRERFEQELAADGFVESALVHGNYYGTLKTEVDLYRGRGLGVILDIDVQGASAVREKYPDNVSIFLKTPDPGDYEERLRRRHTESEESIQRRLAALNRELACASQYDYQVVNDDLDTAVAAVRAIVVKAFKGGRNAG
jgi:guanylate kinase